MSDKLDGLDRRALKALIKEEKLNVVVIKEMTDESIRVAIRRAMGVTSKYSIESNPGPVNAAVSTSDTTPIHAVRAPVQNPAELRSETSVAAAHTPVTRTPAVSRPQEEKKRTTYIILGALLGWLGIHNFYAGYTTKGMVQILSTILLWWTAVVPVGIMIWAIYEVCTVKKDAQGNPLLMT